MTIPLSEDIQYPTVFTFASQMQERLEANSGKGYWGQCNLEYLVAKLEEEVAELKGALHGTSAEYENYPDCPEKAVLLEAADVACVAMMIADIFGAFLQAGRAMSEAEKE